MNSKKIKAVIFDCDGTLVNSEAPTASLITEILLNDGYATNFEEILNISRGVKLSTLGNKLQTLFSDLDPNKFIETYNGNILKKLEADLLPDPTIVKLLKNFPVAMCVASNGSLERTRLALKASNLLQFFDGLIVSAYEINAWKPDPKIILHSSSILNTHPSECLVIDDSVDGLKAGLSAGAQVAAFRIPQEKLGELESSVTQLNNLSEVIKLL